MRRLSNSGAISEARRFKTLLLGRSIGGGAGDVALPQTTAQNQMIISSATPAWTLLAAPTAEGQVPITGADPYTPAWGTTFPTYMTFDTGALFGGYILTRTEDVACGFLSYRYSGDTAAPYWSSRKARGSIASPVVVNDNDELWDMVVMGHDGTGMIAAAGIRVQVDGTPGTDDMPGEILLRTTPDGSSTPQTRVKIRSSGVTEFYNDIAFNATTSHIRMDTSDGSDTKGIALCGGGGFGTARGGRIWLGGNEYAGEEGAVTLTAGNVSGGNIELWTGDGARRMQVTQAGIIVLTVADNTASALTLVDAGATEYLRIISTDAQPVVVFNEGSADVDFRIESDGQANAFFLRGSDGFIGVNTGTPTAWVEIYATGTNYPCLCLTAGTNGELATPTGEILRIGMWNAGTTTFTEKLRVDDDGAWVAEGSAQTRLRGLRQFSVTIPEPIVETRCQIYIALDCTVTGFYGNIIGGTSCTVNVEERSTLGSSGTDILSADMVADANGESVTSGFNNPGLAAGNHLTLDISAVSGTVDEVNVTITVRLT